MAVLLSSDKEFKSQLEKFDKELRYVKHWVPEYGTSSYVKPIVEHAIVTKRTIAVFKETLNS